MSEIQSRLEEINRLLTWAMDNAKTSLERKTAMSAAQEIAKSAAENLTSRDEQSQAALARVRKVRDQYADQARFADIEPAVWFREFVSRLDKAVEGQP